ncbi:MAG: hypothetical protein RH942_18590 [Kiloniellaceae bacterium]
MTARLGTSVLRKTLRTAFAVLGLGLSACAADPSADGGERFVVFAQEAQTIDLAETDLTLPLTSPLEISTVRKRVGEGQIFENYYSFHQVKGYIRTSRVAFGHFSTNVSNELRRSGDFHRFASNLSVPPGDKLEVGKVSRFENGDPHTLGFYTLAAGAPYHQDCFVARIGYRLVDYASVEREPESVDTLVEVLLCGKLPKREVLLSFLATLKAVENRENYRRELSKRPIGTI